MIFSKLKKIAKKILGKLGIINTKNTMVKGDWGHEKRVWGIQEKYDSGRMIPIYEAIKDLEFNSLIDIACGYGLVADGLKWVFPNKKITQFDFCSYPEWEHLYVTPYEEDVMEFIKKDDKYDIVLFLDSYRNWDRKKEFNEWLYSHAKYFITSGESGIEREKKNIGVDAKGYALEIYKIN